MMSVWNGIGLEKDLYYYSVEILNSELQDILWLKLSNENDIID